MFKLIVEVQKYPAQSTVYSLRHESAI